jgi:osmotically-inducible protein OsmY
VNVDNGQVKLTGTVRFYREKKMMQTIASWQKGVKAIVNDLEVMGPDKAMEDKNLNKVLDQVLKYEFPNENKVRFEIDKGKVELFGTTETTWAKENIPEVFSEIRGIKSVENNLKIKTF